MILIGMLHYRKDPITVKKAYTFASVAKLEGADFIYFSPKSVNFEMKKIHGYKYHNGAWVLVQERLPDVVIKTGLSKKYNQYKSILKELRSGTPFTSQSIGNKMTIYNRLVTNKLLSNYLIPSRLIQTEQEFTEFFNKHQQVVLKRNRGHRGRGIVYIEKLSNRFKIMTRDSNYTLTTNEFNRIIKTELSEQSHHIQPYIECKTKMGQAYILRSHIQKNGEDNWVMTSLYPEIASNNSIVANLNCGGMTTSIDRFLKQEFGDLDKKIMKQIEELSYKIGVHLEYFQKKHKKSMISELGIDIGIDKNQKPWIFEVNDLPGSPPLFDLELDIVRNQIKYAIYLASKKRE